MRVDAGPKTVAVPRRLFCWLHTASRQSFETGIQRVAWRLADALREHGFDVVAVGRDQRTGLVETIGGDARAFEAALADAGERPLLLVPEITADLVAGGIDPACMGQAYGMRTMTVLHDTIPLKLRELYAPEAQAMFEAYYESFARTDEVLATRDVVADELRRFLGGRALRVPPVTVIPLPAQFAGRPRVTEPAPLRRADEPLRLVAVVTWERRKNLLRLLRALAQAQRDQPISLALVGRRGFDEGYDAEVKALLAEARDVAVPGPLPDGDLASLIAQSHATIYPSWEEGFGLPVGESLWLGRPCLCHTGVAMAAPDASGGTLALDMTDESAIADALVAVARDPDVLARLNRGARARPLASWADYGAMVAEHLGVA